MGQDGWVEQSEKVDKGGFAAADFMFTAKVTRFGSKQTKIGLGGFVPGNLGNLGIKQSDNDVRIDWRLVDVATRKIIKTGWARLSKKVWASTSARTSAARAATSVWTTRNSWTARWARPRSRP